MNKISSRDVIKFINNSINIKKYEKRDKNERGVLDVIAVVNIDIDNFLKKVKKSNKNCNDRLFINGKEVEVKVDGEFPF